MPPNRKQQKIIDSRRDFVLHHYLKMTITAMSEKLKVDRSLIANDMNFLVITHLIPREKLPSRKYDELKDFLYENKESVSPKIFESMLKKYSISVSSLRQFMWRFGYKSESHWIKKLG